MELFAAIRTHCARCLAIVGIATAAALLAISPAAAAAGAVQPYGSNDFGGFRNVLPPGTNGLVNAADLLKWETLKLRPAHNDDQLAMYSNLTAAAPNIQPAQIDRSSRTRPSVCPPGTSAPRSRPSRA